MRYTVGAYSFDVPKPFKSNAEAVKHVQERYPHLLEDEIVKHLKPSIDESYKSGDSTEKSTESDKADTENNRRGVSKNETRGNK